MLPTLSKTGQQWRGKCLITFSRSTAAGHHAARDRRDVRRLLDAQRRRLHVGRRVADHPVILPRARHVAGVRQLERQQRLVRRPKPELPARLQRPLSDGVLLRDAPQEGVAVLP